MCCDSGHYCQMCDGPDEDLYESAKYELYLVLTEEGFEGNLDNMANSLINEFERGVADRIAFRLSNLPVPPNETDGIYRAIEWLQHNYGLK